MEAHLMDTKIEGGQNVGQKWVPSESPWRVTFTSYDNRPGMYGWSTRSYTFTTLDQALAVAAMPMSKYQHTVAVDCAKNRDRWNNPDLEDHRDNRTAGFGYWEPVGSRCRKTKAAIARGWKFSHLWSMARVNEVSKYYDVKGTVADHG